MRGALGLLSLPLSLSPPLPSPRPLIALTLQKEESFLEGKAPIPGNGGGCSPAGTRCRWSGPGSSHPVKGKGAQVSALWAGVHLAHLPQKDLLLCVPIPLGRESEGKEKRADQEEVVSLLLGHT